jgi:hypothetical protein
LKISRSSLISFTLSARLVDSIAKEINFRIEPDSLEQVKREIRKINRYSKDDFLIWQLTELVDGSCPRAFSKMKKFLVRLIRLAFSSGTLM